MKKVYAVIGDTEFVMESARGGGIVVNGERVAAELVPMAGGKQVLLIGTKLYEIERIPAAPGTEGMVIMVNRHPVTVRLEDDIERIMRQAGGAAGSRAHHGAVRAPMPGKVTRILVGPGDVVQAGQGVLLLEAMKMENELRAPVSGTVTAVHAREQDAVEKNALLIELE